MAALTLVFLGSLVTIAPPPASAATGLTRQISAVRYSQIVYEGAMRAADREVKSLKRARKQARRNLRKSTARLKAAVARRAATKKRLTITRSELKQARSALTESTAVVPVLADPSSAILALHARLTAGAGEAGEPDSLAGHVPGFLDLAMPAAVASAPETASSEAVTTLEQQLKKQKRAYKKARKRARRVWQQTRSTRNRLAVLKSRERGAIARREYAEAALAVRILSMSTLAQRRLSKKTAVKRATDQGFAWPARGRISQGYGCTGFAMNPPRGSCRHFHDGLDIAGYRGAWIRAAAVGVVSYIGWNPWDQHGRAFMIVVAHPGGYETLYGHVLPTRRVRVGQVVRKGEVIGYMGSTGRSTGTHLHFELRRGRTTLNPLAFL